MTLYEKIMELRKRNGLSQEELGAEIGVSRQAVSKWEMAQTTPDLDKIMAMSELFGVSTDFLLKEEYDLSVFAHGSERFAAGGSAGKADEEIGGKTEPVTAAEETKRFISLEEIQKYLSARTSIAKNYVISCFLFFLSPFAGLFLLLFDESKAIIGSVVQIIILIIAAVTVVLAWSNQTEFRFLKSDNTELAYGVRGVIEKRLEEFHHTHLIGIIVGVICVIGCGIPMMIISAFTAYNDVAIVICGCLMLLISATGVSSILYVQCIERGYKKILKMK